MSFGITTTHQCYFRSFSNSATFRLRKWLRNETKRHYNFRAVCKVCAINDYYVSSELRVRAGLLINSVKTSGPWSNICVLIKDVNNILYLPTL